MRDVAFALAAAQLVPGCAQPHPGDELPRRGDEIMVCGRLFHTGTRIVLWTDPGGFDAYRVYRRFSNSDKIAPSRPVAGTETPNRYSPIRGNLPDDMAKRVIASGWTLADLQQVVDQFVIHYDVCGTSRRCFEVLQDVRGLSVHFMLDVDGTIYQTLDLKERARHAGTANDRSIGVEIANMGAYSKAETLAQWYARDSDGRVRLILPDDWRPHATDLWPITYHPASDVIRQGRINGSTLYQFDFTDAQYEALARLTAAVTAVLPRIQLRAPEISYAVSLADAMQPHQVMEPVAAGPLAGTPIFSDPFGQYTSTTTSMSSMRVEAYRATAITDVELRDFSGLLGHYHVTRDKSDPGPAFDWDRLLTAARRLYR